MLLPSITCFGKLDPVISATVGRRSIVIAGSEQFLPWPMLSGHLMMQGTLTPPSQAVPLPSLNGFADPAWFP